MDNKINGLGLYRFCYGVTYTGLLIFKFLGSWKNENPNGYGRETYTDGGYYEGLFLNGMKHGDGKLVFENGQMYLGKFV